MTVDGTATDLRSEGYYIDPDSGRITTDRDSPFRDMIVKGEMAWTKGPDGWTERDPEDIDALVFSNIKGILSMRDHRGYDDAGPGPSHGGETTRRYQRNDQDLWKDDDEALERLSDSSPECAARVEEFKAFTPEQASVEIVAGEKTGFVYSMVMTYTTGEESVRHEFTIDQYNSAIEIDAPLDYAAKQNETDAPDPCFP